MNEKGTQIDSALLSGNEDREKCLSVLYKGDSSSGWKLTDKLKNILDGNSEYIDIEEKILRGANDRDFLTCVINFLKDKQDGESSGAIEEECAKGITGNTDNQKAKSRQKLIEYSACHSESKGHPSRTKYNPNYFWHRQKYDPWKLTGYLGYDETEYDVAPLSYDNTDAKMKLRNYWEKELQPTFDDTPVHETECVDYPRIWKLAGKTGNSKIGNPDYVGFYFHYRAAENERSHFLAFGCPLDFYEDEDVDENGCPKNKKLAIILHSETEKETLGIIRKRKDIHIGCSRIDTKNLTDKDWLFALMVPDNILNELPNENGKVLYTDVILGMLKAILGDGRMTPKELAELVEARYQLILNGAPGTGKTYTADIIAKMIVLGKTEEEVKKLSEQDKKLIAERIKKVQFHPGYDYSDFIIGLKPVLIQDDQDGKTLYTKPIPQPEYEKNDPSKLAKRELEGKITLAYAWQNGVFKEFAEKAAKNKEEKGGKADKFVFIIDEINRADLSNVFGEAFSCLEADYRDKEVILPSGHKFSIPENLYIIGTMNDIDRSVESMDFALRRRFAWHEITAEDSAHIIKDKVPEDNRERFKPVIKALETAMTEINDIIAGEYKGDDNDLKNLGLGTEYQLGGAYFVPDAKIIENFNPDDKDQRNKIRDDLWNHHIKVILNDYLRGNKNKEIILGKFEGIYNSAFNESNEEQNEETPQPSDETDNGEQGAEENKTTEE